MRKQTRKAQSRPVSRATKKSCATKVVPRENYSAPGRTIAGGFGSARIGRVGSHRTTTQSRHPLVGSLLRVRIPIRGTYRVAVIRIVDHGTARQEGEVVRVRTIAGLGVMPLVIGWVPVAQLTFLILAGLAEVVTTMPCGDCGSSMTYQRDGLVNDKPQPFFACDGCENCVVI